MDGIGAICWRIFQPDLLEKFLRFCPFLEEADDLAHLIWKDISVLVLGVSLPVLFFLIAIRGILFITLFLFELFNFR